jgi:hypothetical protein
LNLCNIPEKAILVVKPVTARRSRPIFLGYAVNEQPAATKSAGNNDM